MERGKKTKAEKTEQKNVAVVSAEKNFLYSFYCACRPSQFPLRRRDLIWPH